MHVPTIQQVAVDLGVSSIDVSSITSGHRALTRACARYIYEQKYDNGSPVFTGIRYSSRFASPENWECWAMFDDRMSRSREGWARPIPSNDRDLEQVAYEFNLTIVDDEGQFVRVSQ